MNASAGTSGGLAAAAPSQERRTLLVVVPTGDSNFRTLRMHLFDARWPAGHRKPVRVRGNITRIAHARSLHAALSAVRENSCAHSFRRLSDCQVRLDTMISAWTSWRVSWTLTARLAAARQGSYTRPLVGAVQPRSPSLLEPRLIASGAHPASGEPGCRSLACCEDRYAD